MSTNEHEFLADEPFVHSLRDASRALDARYDSAAEDALIERVLERTVHARRPSTAVAPLFSFDGLASAFRRSGLVRLVAASLALHLGALAVVGMLALREKPAAPLSFRVAPVEEPAFDESEETLALDIPDAINADVNLDGELDAERRANRLRLDRFLLARDAQLLLGTENEAVSPLSSLAPEVGLAIEHRIDCLRRRTWTIPKSSELALGAPQLVATATALDGFVFTGAADGLREQLLRLAVAPPELQQAATRLRARGRAYGILEGSDFEQLHPLLDLFEKLPR